MKVLFVASGNRNSGLGIVVKNQASSLIASGQHVSFYLIKQHGAIGYLKSVLPLKRLIASNKYDIIHSHYSFSGIVTTIALHLNFRRTPPHIVSLMGSDILSKNVLKNILISIFAHFWNYTIVKSNSMYNNVKTKKKSIIPNGVDIKEIKCIEKEAFKEHLPVKNKNSHILFAADPNRKEKNFELAKNACEKANRELKLVYGVNHKELIREIFTAGILLLTSKWEGSPNIIKEAMACNCPIVATNVGDIEWLFGKTEGHYLTNFDCDQVVHRIDQAYSFLNEKGKTNGRARIKDLGLGSDQIASKLVDLYQNIISSR